MIKRLGSAATIFSLRFNYSFVCDVIAVRRDFVRVVFALANVPR